MKQFESLIESFELLNITDVNMFMFNTGKIKVANTKKLGDISRSFYVLKQNLIESNISEETEENFIIKVSLQL